MKKIIFTLIVVIAMGISAVAQDGFFRSDNGGGGRTGEPGGGLGVITPGLPDDGIGVSNSDKPAPLGSGLLVLTALGVGYALSRRRKHQV